MKGAFGRPAPQGSPLFLPSMPDRDPRAEYACQLVASFRGAVAGAFMGIHMGGGSAVEANSAPR